MYFNGYIFKDVSPIDTYYKSYPNSGGQCSFVLSYSCVEQTSEEDCGGSSVEINKNKASTILTKAVIYNGGISNVIQLFITTTIGMESIIVNAPQSFALNITLECLENGIDFSNAQFKLKNNYLLRPNSIGHQVIGEYELLGVNIPKATNLYLSISLDPSIKSSCSLLHKAIGSNLFTFQCLYFPQGYVEPSEVTFKSYGSEITFPIVSFKTMFIDYGYYVYDVKTYPSDLSNLQLFGYRYSALLSFKTNLTTSNIGFFTLNKDDIALDITYFYPVSSDHNSSTFLVPLIVYDQLSGYDLYYQNDLLKFIKANDNKINSKIINYPFSDSFLLSGISKSEHYSETAMIGLTVEGSRGGDLNPFLFYYNYNYETTRTLKGFPFGYITSTSDKLTFQFSTLVKGSYQTAPFLHLQSIINPANTIQLSYSVRDPITYDESLKPRIYKVEKFYLNYDIFILRVYANIHYGFNYFIDNSNNIIGYESYVGGNETDSIFEIRNFESFSLLDQALYKISFSYGGIIYIDDQAKAIRNYENPIIPDYEISSIKNISFLYNDLDITTRRNYNVMYFNFSDNVPRESSFQFQKYSDTVDQLYTTKFNSTWNDKIKQFQIEFYIDANSADVGNYVYTISNRQTIVSNSLDSNAQLIIKKSNLDNQGPIFKSIISTPLKVNSSNKFGTIGWTIVIEDQSNGFENGYVIVKGKADESTYNITLNVNDVKLGGDQFLGEYDVKVNISYPCITQDYVISQVKLYDRMKRVSSFNILRYEAMKNIQSVLNPFINLLQDPSINKVSLECAIDPVSSTDTTPPQLKSFLVSHTLFEVDVSSSSRNITFMYEVEDPESGIKDNVYPTIYISDSNNQVLECNSNESLYGDKFATFKCTIELPFGFGYPGLIIFQVFGLINRNGLYSGYSTQNLKDLGYEWYLQTTFEKREQVLTGHMLITEKGGDLWLYGVHLESTVSVTIEYDSANRIVVQPSKLYSTAILIKNIRATKYSFKVLVQSVSSTGDLVSSNTLIVRPTDYSYYLIECNNGIPKTGGGGCICNSLYTTLDIKQPCTVPNHYISSSTQVLPATGGEITIFGWFGFVQDNPSLFINNKKVSIDPTSVTSDSFKVIIDPGKLGPVNVVYIQNSITFNGTIYPYLSTEKECPPKCSINGICDKTIGKCICNSGYTGLDCSSPITNNNNNTETEVGNNGTTVIKNQDLGFTISIDSIIELDFNNNQVSSFNLSNNWIFVNKVNSTSTFVQTRYNEDETTASINLIIEEVNDNDKDFSFAGNQFTVLKGGFKLSISITNWLYKSNLNRLSLHMSSDIKSTLSNDCNSETIIESSSSSNYLKNNINYLKIIKNNNIFYARFQDKMLADNRTTTIYAQLLPTSNKDLVTVVLNLPRCDSCIIDPDFSLLVSSNQNNQCESSRKWVVAVAVVCGAVGLVILVIAGFLIFKRSTFLKIKFYSFKKTFKK